MSDENTKNHLSDTSFFPSENNLFLYISSVNPGFFIVLANFFINILLYLFLLSNLR